MVSRERRISGCNKYGEGYLQGHRQRQGLRHAEHCACVPGLYCLALWQCERILIDCSSYCMRRHSSVVSA